MGLEALEDENFGKRQPQPTVSAVPFFVVSYLLWFWFAWQIAFLVVFVWLLVRFYRKRPWALLIWIVLVVWHICFSSSP